MKLILITMTLFTALPKSTQAGVFPLAASYDGIGGVYGVAYSQKFSEGHSLLVGGAGGDLTAFGALYTKMFNKNFEVSLGALVFDNVQLTTTYERGLTDDENDRYLLNFKGNAYALGSKLWLLSDYLVLGFSATQSKIEFDSYQDSSQDEISLTGANLFDIDTTELKLSIEGRFYDNPRVPTMGIGVLGSISDISGRTGQSDQKVLNYGANIIAPLSSFFSLRLKAQYSDAIVRVNTSYDTDTEIRTALGANCSSIVDASERASCERLENNLVDYILLNNTRGTATPIGGSGGPRSFRQLRFKAAHTALYSIEGHTSLSKLFNFLNNKNSNFLFVIFHDTGYANDDKSRLFENFKVSNGVGLRITKGSNAINLQAARGSDESSSWSLSLGSAI